MAQSCFDISMLAPTSTDFVGAVGVLAAAAGATAVYLNTPRALRISLTLSISHLHNRSSQHSCYRARIYLKQTQSLEPSLSQHEPCRLRPLPVPPTPTSFLRNNRHGSRRTRQHAPLFDAPARPA